MYKIGLTGTAPDVGRWRRSRPCARYVPGVSRVVIVVLDAVGAGALPDADRYGDEGANTLGNLADAVRGLVLPNLEQLGLGRCLPLRGVSAAVKPRASYGRLAERSAGKDTTAGHWEMMGIVSATPEPTFPEGFPPDLLDSFSSRTGRSVIGNVAMSGTDVLERYGAEQLQTGAWIVYTSADSVFQIAAHEQLISLDELYAACQIARELCQGPYAVGRVIARPFSGEPGSFARTDGRHDYALVPPTPNYLQQLRAAGVPLHAVGKIGDIFPQQGFTSEIRTASNADGIAATIELMRHERGLIFTNLVETDQTYGHRRDSDGFHRCLQEFDAFLPDLIAALEPDDLLLVTSDHGCDPTFRGTDHTREYGLLLAYGTQLTPQRHDGCMSDIGATTAAWLGVPPQKLPGEVIAGCAPSI